MNATDSHHMDAIRVDLITSVFPKGKEGTGRSQWRRGLRHELSSPANTEVVGSHSTRDMDVCVRLFCV
jgi:hypothetical protein